MAPKFRPNARFSLRPRPQAPSAADFESNHALVLQLLTEWCVSLAHHVQ